MAFQVQNTSVAGWGGSNTTFTITKNTSLAVGDTMVAHIVCIVDNSGDVINTPTNWTKIGSEVKLNTSGSTYLHQCLFWKIATAGDVAASNFTFTFTVSATFFNGAIYRISDANGVTPIDVEASGSQADSATFDKPGVTPTYADSIYLILASKTNGDDAAIGTYAIATSNPSWTEDYDSNTATRAIAGASASRSAATATGNFSFVMNGAACDSIGQLVVIKPIVNVTVSPSVINSTAAVLSPTVTGGATVSVSTINSTATVLTPEAGQSDFSAQSKSTGGTWTPQPKS